MASSSDIFQQVRSAVDIVEIIGEHVALKRAGREFKGLCPFHEDHRPSMAVVPHKQIFHCFVCGTGGDVFKFVTLYHKMTSGEALRMLAQRAGIKLPELPGRGPGARGKEEGPSQREQIAATNEWACAFFEKILRSPEGKKGLDYFHGRGLTDETIAKFRLGMAPDSWTGLVTAAMRMGIKGEALEAAGLIKRRQDGSPYDIFRGRVMFPIVDATGGGGQRGRVIAFGGRVLEEKRDEQGVIVEAKYLNSPETLLFNKSQSVYGLNHARQQIVRTRTAVVVEGYMDVIACHQAAPGGVSNVIATLGTALTPEHARTLKNYAQTIVLMFDSDDAGYRAADRAMEVFVRTQLDIKLSSVPNGKDPCDFCMKPPPEGGGEAFQKLVDSATDALTYQWNRVLKSFSATDSLGARQEAVMQYLRFVATGMENGAGGLQAMDPVRRGLLLSKIAGMVHISVEEVAAILRKLGRAENRNPKSEIRNPEGAGTNPGVEAAAAEAMAGPEAGVDVRQLRGLDAAEGCVLGALLAKPALYEKFREELTLRLFVRLREAAAVVLECLENHGDLSACRLADLASGIEDDMLRGQVLELERQASERLEPAFSPLHIKMVEQSRGDRGVSLEAEVAAYLRQLHEARGGEDPALAADLGEMRPGPQGPADPEARALEELRGLVARKVREGGNRANIGLGK